MGRQTLADLLYRAQAELHDENIVTLLGEPSTGKTVVSALLKHALFDKFIPMHGGRFQAIVERGGDRIDRILKGMKVDCRFPSATTRVDAPKTVLEVHKMIGEGVGKIKLVFQDSSGEEYMELMHRELDDPKKRLEEILAHNNEDGKIGPFAPYVFSKVYLLAIECSKDKLNWDLKHASSAINTLHKIHTEANRTHNRKIMTNIAILFTKSDMLGDEEKNKPARELLERISELKSALQIHHRGQLECFKLSIDVEPETTSDRDLRVSHARKQANNTLQRKRNEYQQDVNNYVSAYITRAKKEGESRYDVDDLEEYVKDETLKAEQRFRASHPAPILEFDEREESEIKDKVKKGFTYSQDEYVRLITWIINRVCD